MHPEYFETRFRAEDVSDDDWPAEFGIISAFATTGESWTEERNQAADRELEGELHCRSIWRRRIVGFSPTTDHAEPSWAVALPLDATCDLGLRFRQDAVYYVRRGVLYVSYCDERRRLVEVGRFRERLRIVGE